MKHILIVDDDIHINKMLDEVLVHERYMVSHAYSGTEALLFLADTKPDLILLDLMLPGLSGEELLPQISDIPIIVMSAKVDVEDKVSLLLGGAVDYVTKPFDTKELLARITVALRVKTPSLNRTLEFEDITLDTFTYEVFIEDKKVKLTRTEYAILKLLIHYPVFCYVPVLPYNFRRSGIYWKRYAYERNHGEKFFQESTSSIRISNCPSYDVCSNNRE